MSELPTVNIGLVTDKYIYSHGETLVQLGSAGGKVQIFDELCIQMNKKMSQAKVDWRLIAGRGMLLYVGSYDEAKKIFTEMTPWINEKIRLFHEENSFRFPPKAFDESSVLQKMSQHTNISHVSSDC